MIRSIGPEFRTNQGHTSVYSVCIHLRVGSSEKHALMIYSKWVIMPQMFLICIDTYSAPKDNYHGVS